MKLNKLFIMPAESKMAPKIVTQNHMQFSYEIHHTSLNTTQLRNMRLLMHLLGMELPNIVPKNNTLLSITLFYFLDKLSYWNSMAWKGKGEAIETRIQYYKSS